MHGRPQRKRQRLAHFDYSSPGPYFVTFCTAGRACLFGAVADGAMAANDLGAIVERIWLGLPEHFPGLDLDAFVVMPNHFHGLVSWSAEDDHHLSVIIGNFKSWSARAINQQRAASTGALWQRGFYEHVVRNDADLDRIRTYILENPIRWDLDPENPQRRGEPAGRV